MHNTVFKSNTLCAKVLNSIYILVTSIYFLDKRKSKFCSVGALEVAVVLTSTKEGAPKTDDSRIYNEAIIDTKKSFLSYNS
jgi:hypothetical protein